MKLKNFVLSVFLFLILVSFVSADADTCVLGEHGFNFEANPSQYRIDVKNLETTLADLNFSLFYNEGTGLDGTGEDVEEHLLVSKATTIVFDGDCSDDACDELFFVSWSDGSSYETYLMGFDNFDTDWETDEIVELYVYSGDNWDEFMFTCVDGDCSGEDATIGNVEINITLIDAEAERVEFKLNDLSDMDIIYDVDGNYIELPTADAFPVTDYDFSVYDFEGNEIDYYIVNVTKEAVISIEQDCEAAEPQDPICEDPDGNDIYTKSQTQFNGLGTTPLTTYEDRCEKTQEEDLSTYYPVSSCSGELCRQVEYICGDDLNLNVQETTCPHMCIEGICSDTCTYVGHTEGGDYCDTDMVYRPQKAAGETCANDYECEDYSCVDLVCQSKLTDVELELHDLSEFNLSDELTVWGEIWSYLQGYQCNPLTDTGYHCEGSEAFLCGLNGVWEPKGEIPGVCGVPITCGDGVVDPNTEQCDDGNLIDEDDCTNECNWNICGDYIINRNQSKEQCDDGANGVLGDGCTDACTSESCTVEEVGNHTCIGYYDGVCDSMTLMWTPLERILGMCGVECLLPGNNSCDGTTSVYCNGTYIWEIIGLIEGQCGYTKPSQPSGGGGGGGSRRTKIKMVIFSPQDGITYGNTVIPLQVEDIKNNANYWSYSLNGARKISFVPNASITIAREGENNLIVFAREEFNDRREASSEVTFYVDLPPATEKGYCGDGLCKDESCETCAIDCGACIVSQVIEECGDGVCGVDESSYTCELDCEAKKRTNYTYVAAGGVVLALGALAFFLYRKFFMSAARKVPEIVSVKK